MSLHSTGSVPESKGQPTNDNPSRTPTPTQEAKAKRSWDILSRSSSQSTVHIASAIDFLPDGRTSEHAVYGSSRSSASSPIFECPVQPKSVRIVFFYTRDVFPQFDADANSASAIGDERSLLLCPNCDHQSESDSHQNTSTSRISSKPSSISQVSPGTSILNPHIKGTDIRRSSEDDDSFVYVRREKRSRSSTHSRSRTRSRTRRSSSSMSPFSSRSSSRSNDSAYDESKTWKRYRGGFSVDSMDVFRLWEREAEEKTLRIGINLMFDDDDDVEAEAEKIWAKTIRDERHTMTLNGDLAAFFTVPHLLRVSRQADKDTLEVEARLYTTYMKGMQNTEGLSDSPLSIHLWDILRSRKSAMALFDGNTDMGARLLAFDVLSATVLTWLNFLHRVRRKGAWQPRSFGDLDSLDQQRPMLGDREHIADFGRSTRDLLQAVDICIKAIELTHKFSDDQRVRFDYLLLTRRSQHEVLQSTMKDIEDYIDGMFARAEQLTNERQDASLKRLTLVASIFLPLTMACSILSMSTRVNALGALWWDWLGIVCIIGLLVLTGYRATSGWHNFWRKPRLQWAVSNFRREWDRAKVDVIKKEAKEKEKQDHESKTRRRKRKRRQRPQRYLVPTFNRMMFRMSKYLFVISAVASFLVGMFLKVATGAEALGYSAAGTILVVFGSIIIWRLLRLLISRKAKPSNRKNQKGKGEGKKAAAERKNESQKPSGTSNQNGETNEDKKSKGGWKLRILFRCIGIMPIGIIAKIFLVPLIWIGKLWYALFTIFFGELVLKVAWQALLNVIIDRVPMDLTLIFQSLKRKGLSKRNRSDSNDDIESRSGRNRSRSRTRSDERGRSRSRSRSPNPRETRNEPHRFGLGRVLTHLVTESPSRISHDGSQSGHLNTGDAGSQRGKKRLRKTREDELSRPKMGIKKAETFAHPQMRRAETKRFGTAVSEVNRSATDPVSKEVLKGKEG